MKELKTVFVVSTGRCGTKSLAEAFKAHIDFKAFHEPSQVLNVPNRLAWEGHDMSRVIELIEKPMVSLVHTRGYNFLDSSPQLGTLGSALVKVFPDAYFLHLVRDGIDVVRSAMGTLWYKDKPFNPVNCMYYPNEYETRFERCCWRWTEVNRIILDQVGHLEKYRLQRLEDISGSDLGSILDWLGLEPIPLAMPHENKSKREFPAYPDWTEDQKRQAKEIMGAMRAELGYK